jgi:hypothetical protein
MPRYFFNILVRGRTIHDPEGDNLAGDKEAKAHAKLIARGILESRDRYRRGVENWQLVITDRTGRQIGIVPLSPARRIRKLRRSS